MRMIDRSPCPTWLDGPTSRGGTETAEAALHYSKSPAAESFEFKEYGHATVREALSHDFNWKCAYCESRVWHVAAEDVDHYRPKGGFRSPAGKLTRPGYYWLGAEWTNLFPSCPHCNRLSTQSTTAGVMTVGKGNHFPLADEARRATSPGLENLEEPLLLHPNQIDVEDHLEFGEEGVVRPALIGGTESSRAEASIRIFGLHRISLCQERARHWQRVLNAIDRFQQDRTAYVAAPSGFLNMERLISSMRELREFLCCQQTYLAMTRQLISAKCPELVPLPGCTEGFCLSSSI